MPLRISLITVLMLSFYGCTFTPTEEIYKHVEKPRQAETLINFFNATDTVVLRGNTGVALYGTSTDQTASYRLAIGSTEIMNEEGPPGYVDIASEEIPDGVYDMILTVVKVATDGESMATQLGLETYEQEFSRKVWIYNAPLTDPVITTRIEDGVLIAEWEPYTGPDFGAYTVSADAIFPDVVITNPNINSVSLPHYAGGRVYIGVSLTAVDEFAYESIVYESFTNTQIERNDPGVLITWEPSSFKSWAGTHIIIQKDGIEENFHLDPSITEFQYNGTWAFPYDLKVTVHTKGGEGREFFLAEKTFSTKIPGAGTVPGFATQSKFYPNPSIDTLIVGHFYSSVNSSQQGYLSLLHKTTGHEFSLRQGRLAVSPNGRFLYEFDTERMVNISPDDLQSSGEFNISNLISSTGTLRHVFVSDENKILLYYQEGEEEKYYVFDWETKTLMFSGATFESRQLTPDGTLTNDGRKVYKKYEIITIDVMPNELTHLEPAARWEVGLSNVDKSIRWIDRLHLVEDKNYRPYDGLSIPYSKDILQIFGNRDNQIGIAYIDSDKIKVDIFELGTLTLLTTVETSLDVSQQGQYNFSMINNELFVYIGGDFARPTVHTTKVDF